MYLLVVETIYYRKTSKNVFSLPVLFLQGLVGNIQFAAYDMICQLVYERLQNESTIEPGLLGCKKILKRYLN
jgi:hypothetical protein